MGSNKCKACGAEISGAAVVCPGCGAKARKTMSPLPIMVAGLIVAALIVALFGR